MYKVYIMEFNGCEYYSTFIASFNSMEQAEEKEAELRAELGCCAYVEDTTMEDYTENMPCDNTGHCSGMSCKNYYNCH